MNTGCSMISASDGVPGFQARGLRPRPGM